MKIRKQNEMYELDIQNFIVLYFVFVFLGRGKGVDSIVFSLYL